MAKAENQHCIMNSFPKAAKRTPLGRFFALLVLLAANSGSAVFQPVRASTNVLVWDTASPLTEGIDSAVRSGWKRVPTDLFELEADPAKASSDPGYYGRDYVFKGDLVVETPVMSAVFASAKGKVVLYSKENAALAGDVTSRSGNLGRKIAEIAPLGTLATPVRIQHFNLLRNAGDEAVVEVLFSAAGLDSTALFSFGKSGIVEVKPAENMRGISLLCPMDYAVAPSFIGDDLVYGPAGQPAPDSLCVPADNLFLGLLKGEDCALVMTWPKGRQQLRLKLGTEKNEKSPLESLDFENDGHSIFLAALSAPGIWHEEELSPSYLEKDVSIKWKRPFTAKWKTQLNEAGVRTTFAFRDSKGTVWRGVPGMYDYPVWFDGDAGFYHLSKKVPPKGESLIYFLEGQDTPLTLATPVEIMQATLGREESAPILDVPGRKLRTHHRRGADGVRRACTCGCTEAIQSVFETGEEVARKAYIDAAVDDMIFFVQCHLERIDEYRQFSAGLLQFLEAKTKGSPNLKPFTDDLVEIIKQIPDGLTVQQENMKSLKYAGELARKTSDLAGRKDSHNLTVYMELLKEWRAMGGAQDYSVAQCHTITRKLFQAAGYACASHPEAVELAREIRNRCRQCLRNPDGYEIWPNY